MAHPQDCTLLHDFSDCERGNTWLVNDDLTVQLAYIRMGQEDNNDKPVYTWLEISICTDNYPGLNVALVHKSEDELAKHITEKCEGMYARKCNVEGVKLDLNNKVIGLDDETEQEIEEEAAAQEDKDRRNGLYGPEYPGEKF